MAQSRGSMSTAELLKNLDRCQRLAHYSRSWEFSRLHPTEVLRRAVDAGLTCGEDDPGHNKEKANPPNNRINNPSKAQKRSSLCHDVILLQEAARIS